jgi:hypothetical protein
MMWTSDIHYFLKTNTNPYHMITPANEVKFKGHSLSGELPKEGVNHSQ